MFRILAVLVACWLLVSCAHSPSARSTAGWNEYETAHFTLDTDLDAVDGAEAVRQLEHTRAALLSAAWPKAQLPQGERVHAIVLADDLDFERLFSRQVGALTQRGSEMLLVMTGPPSRWEKRPSLAADASSSVLRHELSHYLASYFYLRQPRWFSEGLAQFLETIQVAPDGKTAELGAVNPGAYSKYVKFRSIMVRDALHWNQTNSVLPEGDTLGLYGLSWAMVHYFYNQHPDQFGRFQAALAKGERPQLAWDEVFGTSRALDEEISHYLKFGKYQQFSVAIQNLDVTLRTRPLTPSEVHLVRAQLALAGERFNPAQASDLKSEVQAEIALALKGDPQNIAALEVKAPALPPAERRAMAKQAVQAHPDNAHAWYLLAVALREMKDVGMEEQAALKKATQLDRGFAEALNTLAWQYVEAGRFKDALPYATRAVQLQPWSAPNVDTLAVVLDGVRRCPDALTTERRAIDLLPEKARPEVLQEYSARLARYQAECGGSAPSSGDSG